MGNDRLHWTSRPFGVLLAVLAAELSLYLVGLAIALPLGLAGASDGQEASNALALLIQALLIVVPLGLAFLFWRLVRRSQLKNGTAQEISWKIGAAFWVGVPLALALVPFLGWDFLSTYPLSAAGYLLSALSSGLVTALFFSILFPVMEKRFGALNAALVISAAFAVLMAMETVLGRVVSVLQYFFMFGRAVDFPLWRGFAENLFSSFITAAALYTLRSALYLAASRRVPGVWLLCASVPGLVSVLYRVIASAIPGAASLSGWLQALCLQFPFYLVIFAASLSLVAVFQRWKTFGAFASDLVQKAKKTQNDIEE